ncbi:glycosyltransferase [Leucobacter sp. GX24907]
MTTLTLIGEPFPDWEASFQRSALEDLTTALAETAPRACSTRLLIGRGSEEPTGITNPRAQVAALPMAASVLPVMWQSGTTARPLDGEFVHSLTPMMPLRARAGDDGTQTSVTVTHTLAWEAPALLGSTHARLYRAFVRRAIKHADVIVTPSYAVASVLQRRYGSDIPVQVLPLAAPTALLRPADHAERRAALGLPEKYFVTTATPSETGRLDWVLEALRADPFGPHVVVLDGCSPTAVAQGSSSKDSKESKDAKDAKGKTESQTTSNVTEAIPEELRSRVTVVQPRDLADIGAVIAGADLLLQPEALADSGYLLHAALAAGVPVLHADCAVAREITLDAGVSASTPEEFRTEFARLSGDGALTCLSVQANDRSRSFGWRNTAWQLWELHANL